MSNRWLWVIPAVLLAALSYYFYIHPPFAIARRDEVLVRASAIDDTVTAYSAGTVLVLPGVHQVRQYSIHSRCVDATDLQRSAEQSQGCEARVPRAPLVGSDRQSQVRDLMQIETQVFTLE